MSDVPAQLRLLLQRAAELREHSDDIQRKLAVVCAEIDKRSTTQDQGLGPRDHPSDVIPPKTPQK